MKFATIVTHRGSLVFSIKFWLVTILLVLFYSTLLFAQYSNTVYLDPTNSGDPSEDGSIDHPYDHITDLTIQGNTQYLLKRGTSMTSTSPISITGHNNVKFGAYGPGTELPSFTRTGNEVVYIRGCRLTVIDSLHLICPEGEDEFIVHISGGSTPHTNNTTISNCELQGGFQGVRSLPYSTRCDTINIINCEIHDQNSDGIFIDECHEIYIEGCHIYDVNNYWFVNVAGADGDCIHIVGNSNNYKVYNNVMDKSNTGKKFGFIYGGSTDEYVSGEVIGNTIIPPHNLDGSSAIYISSKQSRVTIARNRILGRATSTSYPGYTPGSICYIAADTVYFYYNTMDSLNNGGVFTYNISYVEFYNNTIVSPLSVNYQVNFSGVPHVECRNNLAAGDAAYDVIRFTGSTVQQSNNTQINSSNTSLYNSGLGIVDWESSDFHKTTNTNDGIDVGLTYDFDSVYVSNPPERGSCEYIDGGQSNNPPNINNQSFSTEENTGNGIQIGTIIATDPDQGQTLTYTIISGNTDNAFQVNPTTGELTVNNETALDYETNPEFSLTVQVQDNGVGSLSDQAVVTVDLLDLNEIPEIEDQEFSLEENSPDNHEIGIVQASDPDFGQELTYTILSGNIDDAFAMNESSGRLTVNNSSALNFETNTEFVLSIQVQDNGVGTLSAQAIVTINIIDINEIPEIEDQEFSLEENSPDNHEIGIVQASDPDFGQELTYTILSGNIDDAFAMNESSGKLTVNNSSALNFETNTEFVLSIQVQDNGVGTLSAQAIVTISIIDINEIPEIDDQYFSLDEIGSYNMQIGNIEASDPDFSQTLTYSILSGNANNAFQVNSSTGGLTIYNYSAIDYESISEFNLIIQVQDDGLGLLTNQAIITVEINDVNEAPTILNQEFTIQIDLENLENDINNNAFVNIGEVEAYDPDIGQNITFSILEGNDRDAFSIDDNTGELIISDPFALYLFEYFNYPLVVLVQDDSPQQLQSTATVNLYVSMDTLSLPERASELLLSKELDNDQFSMKVYPNPTWNYFEIELDNLEPGLTSILIFNTAGEKISQDDFYDYQSKYLLKYNVDNFRNGIYLIQIRNKSAVYYSKIVKI